MSDTGKSRLGILVGGGPAPGINSVISACVIEAVNSGHDVVGILDGFANLIKGDTSGTIPLGIEDVSRIHTRGGSILRTSRANPARSAEHLAQCVATLGELGISKLVTIGGDDTAFSAHEVAKSAPRGELRVAHVPKTIDNDLPLPGDMPTFGYETARHVGAGLVMNLMEDSRATGRWYFVVAMGRKAGHLALGIGKSAGATLTVIPEEFAAPRISLDDITRVLEGAILKRLVMGRRDGVAVLAEGLAEMLDPEELASVPGVEVERDPHGHVQLGEIPLAAIIKKEVKRRFAARSDQLSIVDVTLGYELRSAAPIPFDIEYTRTLGYSAARFLLSAPDDQRLILGGLVCLERDQLGVLAFDDLRDPVTGRTSVRLVDTSSIRYEVARKYMIRVTPEDLADSEMCQSLSEAAGVSVDEFTGRFGRMPSDLAA